MDVVTNNEPGDESPLEKEEAIDKENNKIGKEEKEAIISSSGESAEGRATTSDDLEPDDEGEAETTSEESRAKFDKDEYIYQKLVKKRNHVYSCIANVLKNYNRKEVLDAFIPEREKLAMNLASTLMTKGGMTTSDLINLSSIKTKMTKDLITTSEIISLSAINFLINQVYELTVKGEGELEFSREAKEHLAELAIEWSRLRDQAFMFINGMIKLEYELHGELHFTETELCQETERKLLSIGISQGSSVSSKIKEMRDQRRRIADRAISDLNDLVRSWHSEIAYLRRIPEFYASMRQLSEEEIEVLSMLFENFGQLLPLADLKQPFKEISLKTIQDLQQKGRLSPGEALQKLVYETIMVFELGKENVPYFLCRRIQEGDDKTNECLQIPVISLLLFSRFCNSYSEKTRSKKAHDLEFIVSDIATLCGWDVVDQNIEIVSEGDTVTEIDLIISRKKTFIIIEVKDLALWRGWYFDRESLIKRYEIFNIAAKKLRERRLLLKLPSAKLLIVTALPERWKKVDGTPVVPLKSLHKYLKKLKRLEGKRSAKRR